MGLCVYLGRISMVLPFSVNGGAKPGALGLGLAGVSGGREKIGTNCVRNDWEVMQHKDSSFKRRGADFDFWGQLVESIDKDQILARSLKRDPSLTQ
jgi:hypothetical protein